MSADQHSSESGDQIFQRNVTPILEIKLAMLPWPANVPEPVRIGRPSRPTAGQSEMVDSSHEPE